METTLETEAFDRGLAPALKLVLPEKAQALLDFHPDAELQRRIDELAAKSTEGRLSEEERSEYAGYVRANKFLAILKRQARKYA